ncbi:hypothetical protein [Novipirellula rosea]|uniref:hypothetical protein n=1 Tax=Novipirellula rosea TaxID=1031540 RepID=UPI0031E5BAD5
MLTVEITLALPEVSGVRSSSVRQPLDSWPIDPPHADGWRPTLAELITLAVKNHVKQLRLPNLTPLRRPLSKESLEAGLADGRIRFGTSTRGRRKKSEDDAVCATLDAFERGHFLVFVDEQPCCQLADEVSLTPSSTITFVRTTPLVPGSV